VRNYATLAAFLDHIDDLPDDFTLYVANSGPMSGEIAALAQPEPSDGAAPTGFRYLLEVSLAREAIEVWSEWRSGRQPDSGDKADAVIYYAENNAYMPS
jgi:hypothetical protein